MWKYPFASSVFSKSIRKVAVGNSSLLATQLSAAVHTSQEYMCVKINGKENHQWNIVAEKHITLAAGNSTLFYACICVCT